MAGSLDRLTTVLAALGEPTRLRILALIAEGEVCVGHIHEALRIPQPKASRHLAYLRRAGLVATRRDGLWVHYRLAEPDADQIRQVLSCVLSCARCTPDADQDETRLEARTGRRRVARLVESAKRVL
jgi:ArsR family transcriptional regulator